MHSLHFANRSLKSYRHLLFRRPGVLCETIQAKTHQAWLHPGGRGSGSRHPLRQRLLPDHYLSLRGTPAQLQEHVQVDAAAQEVAGGGRLHDGDFRVHRQDRGPGPEAEEEDQHRGHDQGCPGAALQQESQALRPGNHQPRRLPAAGEGSGASLVLQPEAEGEEDDPAPAGGGRLSGYGREWLGRRPPRPLPWPPLTPPSWPPQRDGSGGRRWWWRWRGKPPPPWPVLSLLHPCPPAQSAHDVTGRWRTHQSTPPWSTPAPPPDGFREPPLAINASWAFGLSPPATVSATAAAVPTATAAASAATAAAAARSWRSTAGGAGSSEAQAGEYLLIM